MSRDIAISVTNLCRVFDTRDQQVTAFKDVSFRIKGGEFACLSGPSGCGKTSLLRCLADLDQPTSGNIEFAGSADGLRPRIGMVFQEHGLFPWMSLLDNVRFVLENQPDIQVTDIGERSRELLHTVGLGEFLNLYPHQVSGGMRQRVSIARCLAIDPPILLMDEPFVFLDYQTRMSLQELLLEIWYGSGKTVIFVTHDIDEAALLADRVLIMSKQPGTIIDELEIELPRPREILATRKDQRYINSVDHITRLIRQQSAGANHHQRAISDET